jgi:hypothetical protein
MNTEYIFSLRFEPQYVLGVPSNLVNIYEGIKHIGVVEAKDIPLYIKGDASVFKPVEYHVG